MAKKENSKRGATLAARVRNKTLATRVREAMAKVIKTAEGYAQGYPEGTLVRAGLARLRQLFTDQHLAMVLQQHQLGEMQAISATAAGIEVRWMFGHAELTMFFDNLTTVRLQATIRGQNYYMAAASVFMVCELLTHVVMGRKLTGALSQALAVPTVAADAVAALESIRERNDVARGHITKATSGLQTTRQMLRGISDDTPTNSTLRLALGVVISQLDVAVHDVGCGHGRTGELAHIASEAYDRLCELQADGQKRVLPKS